MVRGEGEIGREFTDVREREAQRVVRIGQQKDVFAGVRDDVRVFVGRRFNGDALRQETEFGIDGGAVSASERTGLASQTGNSMALTDADGEPIPTCFEGLPPGEYTVSAAAPESYNPTTAQSATLQLTAGDETTLNFGAQLSSEAQSGQLTPEEGGRSPLMGLLGIVLLLSGLGLGAYTWQLARRR